MKAGIDAKFHTQRTVVQKLYCCTLSSIIGAKTKTYEIKEYSLNACLYHITKNYKTIFLELNCPPLTNADILRE